VVGTLWGSVLMPPNVFKGEVARAVNGPIPFTLWVLIQYSKQANGNILISTLGMRDFEHMEIETESALPLDQTFDLVRRFGSYILTKGAIVRAANRSASPRTSGSMCTMFAPFAPT
jgi:hypothetical protein